MKYNLSLLIVGLLLFVAAYASFAHEDFRVRNLEDAQLSTRNKTNDLMQKNRLMKSIDRCEKKGLNNLASLVTPEFESPAKTLKSFIQRAVRQQLICSNQHVSPETGVIKISVSTDNFIYILRWLIEIEKVAPNVRLEYSDWNAEGKITECKLTFLQNL